MAAKASYHFLVLLVLLCSVSSSKARQVSSIISPAEEVSSLLAPHHKLNLAAFPKGFLFGAATSSYQVEGTKGRGLNIWDTFTHRYRERTEDHTDGDVATNSYELYKEDVMLMKDMGLEAYRFSIAWSRVLPGGKLCRGVNEEGIKYYNNLIDELKKYNIQPFVTLFHWDLPQTLEDEYGGFLSPLILNDFRDFADVCFKNFGDRVKHWITLNQPYSYSYKGYGDGSYPPVHCTKPKCTFGDSGTEPYLVAHYLLLAHAEAVNLYRARYQATQKGQIGTTLITRWFLPFDETNEEDKSAAQRSFDFIVGWFLHPLVYGDYPPSMKEIVGERLPKFTPWESERVKGTLDFLGVNYYFTQFAQNIPNSNVSSPSCTTDPHAKLSFKDINGQLIGPPTASFYYWAQGLLEVLHYIKENYQNPFIYITENGFCDKSTLPLESTLEDQERVAFHKEHLDYLISAMDKGCKIGGYFVWSLLDNYEFLGGYTMRFGMNYVDFNNVTDRRQKLSARWYTDLIKQRKIAVQSLSTTEPEANQDEMVMAM